MTISEHWQASDGTSLHCCVDDFTDPWKTPECVILLHPGMGSAQRLYAWVPHLARDLVELLDHLKFDRAHVVGASAGAMVAMHAALRFPERFASLAFFATTAGIPRSTNGSRQRMAAPGSKGSRRKTWPHRQNQIP